MDDWWRDAYKSGYRSSNPGPIVDGDTPTYTYSELDPTVDSIRLVILEPSWEATSLIKCRMQHVAFKDKPRYESLSYAWGDGRATEKIFLDGQVFPVGVNVFLALRHLRDDTKERILWIDAICINQTDIHEKNRQISIMPYIYTRAQRVLVWLGVPLQSLIESYETYTMPPNSLEELWRFVFLRPQDDPRQKNSSITALSDDLLRAMCDELYWTRLWIIQEISLARRVQICYGYNTVDWSSFIRAIYRPGKGLENSVPMKLHLQLAERYQNGHKLHRLLENHQQALCKEPRDHIYGFIGLASDCIEPFPIDYQKSLFEVWKDTLLYRNTNYNASHHDILKFGKLLRRLFGGLDIALAGEVTQDLASRMSLAPLKRDSLHFTARLVGRISFLGPTYHEIIADLKKTAIWKASIHKYTGEQHLAAAMEESDTFLELLEGLDEVHLEMVAPFNLESLWKAQQPVEAEPDMQVVEGNVEWDNSARYIEGGEGERSLTDQIESHTMPNTSGDRQLFLLNLRSRRNDTESRRVMLRINNDDFPGSMGLAPPNTEVGDFVLQVDGVERALIVRREEGVSPRVVGTAILAENSKTGRTSREKSLGQAFKVGIPDFAFGGSDSVKLVMDVALAYHLLVR